MCCRLTLQFTPHSRAELIATALLFGAVKKRRQSTPLLSTAAPEYDARVRLCSSVPKILAQTD